MITSWPYQAKGGPEQGNTSKECKASVTKLHSCRERSRPVNGVGPVLDRRRNTLTMSSKGSCGSKCDCAQIKSVIVRRIRRREYGGGEIAGGGWY